MNQRAKCAAPRERKRIANKVQRIVHAVTRSGGISRHERLFPAGSLLQRDDDHLQKMQAAVDELGFIQRAICGLGDCMSNIGSSVSWMGLSQVLALILV